MLVVTTNEIPGYRVKNTLGECFGLTVRSKNALSNYIAEWRSILGGELKEITNLLAECRQESVERLSAEAEAMGANAVLAFRFETGEYGNVGLEICAYGTAVVVEPIAAN